jgi:molecular chaperone DnaK (HSP70)
MWLTAQVLRGDWKIVLMTSSSFRHGQGVAIVSCFVFGEQVARCETDKLPVTTQKVPTVLSYQDKRMQWGHQVDQCCYPGKERQLIQGVKLLLDQTQKYRYGPASDSERFIKEMGKTPVQVSGDYLGNVVAHARDILTRRFGTALQTMDLRYILTVPAVWSDKAKDNTKQAALQAGIPASDLRLLSEPEAAAVCTIRTIQPNSIAVWVPQPRGKAIH